MCAASQCSYGHAPSVNQLIAYDICFKKSSLGIAGQLCAGEACGGVGARWARVLHFRAGRQRLRVNPTALVCITCMRLVRRMSCCKEPVNMSAGGDAAAELQRMRIQRLQLALRWVEGPVALAYILLVTLLRTSAPARLLIIAKSVHVP